MAEGAASQAWDHTAFLAAWIGTMFGKQRIDPMKLHPYAAGDRRRPGVPKVHPVIFIETLAAALSAKKV
jgi:hypothetical protein